MNGHGRVRPRRLPRASITTTTRVDMSAFGVRPPTPTDVVEDASHLSTMVCVQNLSRGSWEEDVHPSPYHMPVASAQGNPMRDSPKPSEARNDLAHTPAVTGHSGFRAKREPRFRGSVSKAVDMNSSGFRVHRRRTFSDTPAPLWSCDSQFLAAFFSLLYRLVDIFFFKCFLAAVGHEALLQVCGPCFQVGRSSHGTLRCHLPPAPQATRSSPLAVALHLL